MTSHPRDNGDGNTSEGFYSLSRYELDGVGNRTAVTETQGVTRYTYDPLYRLIGASLPNTTTLAYGYVYDPTGNRTLYTDTLASPPRIATTPPIGCCPPARPSTHGITTGTSGRRSTPRGRSHTATTTRTG